MTDLKKLRELAEKATPGPWTALFVFGSSDLPVSICRETGRTINIAGVECPDNDYICEVHSEAANPAPDFRFIAAANPQAIIELLDRLERYEKALIEFADYDNQYEPNMVCWPASDYMRKAREALEGEK